MDPFLFQPVLKTSKRSASLFTLAGVILVLFSILYLAYPSDKSSVSLTQSSLDLQEFQGFMKAHSKQYSSQAEYDYRFQVFQTNSALIRAHNALQTSVMLAANKFADLSQSEFKALYTQEIKEDYSESEQSDSDFLTEPDMVATSWDWRDQGAVTDVPNQSPTCKASWAFAVAASVEAINVINGTNHILYDLSVQEIIDCQTTTKSPGCNGGADTDGFTFVLNNGLTTDFVYPYTGANQPCNAAAVNNSYVNISNYTNVTGPVNLVMWSAVNLRPVVARVEADQYVWQFYQSGIINNFCGSNVNHYVLIVGYDVNNAFYTCKNSWGNTWGESGYVRIGTGTGGRPGICGIQTKISYPTI